MAGGSAFNSAILQYLPEPGMVTVVVETGDWLVEDERYFNAVFNRPGRHGRAPIGEEPSLEIHPVETQPFFSQGLRKLTRSGNVFKSLILALMTLAQAVTYLACAPKSNASTVAIAEARQDVREGRLLPVPVHLRDKHYAGAKRLGHGEGYQYSHDSPGGVAAQDYLGVQREYYRPVDRGFEAELAQRLEKIRATLRAARRQES